MNILCDTCSVLMLIRIAPEMFCDDRFECTTVQEVIKELFQTQKFKTSYPWRKEYKSKIKAMGTSEIDNNDFQICLEAIKNIIQIGKINKRTERLTQHALEIMVKYRLNNQLLTKGCADLILEDLDLMKKAHTQLGITLCFTCLLYTSPSPRD